MSLWMELVLETLHISPALVVCSSVGSMDTSTFASVDWEEGSVSPSPNRVG